VVCRVYNKYLLITLFYKICQTKIAVLDCLYSQRCTLNPNKIDVLKFLYSDMAVLVKLLVWFKIYVSKILDKTDNLLFNYSMPIYFPVRFLLGHSIECVNYKRRFKFIQQARIPLQNH